MKKQTAMISLVTIGLLGVVVLSQKGINTHNPGNIKHDDNNWVGMTNQQFDPNFVTFEKPEFGIRAMGKILDTYFSQGVNTVREIISRYAPSFENPTENYIQFVSNKLFLLPDQPLTLDLATKVNLIKTMIEFEKGSQPYSVQFIANALAL